MEKSQYQIPFDKNGNQLEYYNLYNNSFPTLQDNYEFNDTLLYQTYGRGRSSITFVFKRQSTGKNVSMFVSDLHNAIPYLRNGCLSGKFTFVKKGRNYGCKLVQAI